MSMHASAMYATRPQETANPLPPIPGEIEVLEKHATEFRSLLDRLQERLAPIVAVHPRIAETRDGGPAPPGSPLGQRIRGIATTVAEGNTLLARLLDELHI